MDFSELPLTRPLFRRAALLVTLPLSLWVCRSRGFLGNPHSERSSTNLLARGHDSYTEWGDCAPHARFSAYGRDALLDQDLTDRLPHLAGGGKFVIRSRFHFAPSLRIDQPLAPTEVLRAVSAHHGTLGAVADHARARTQLALPAPAPAPKAVFRAYGVANIAPKAAYIAPEAADPAPAKATAQT